ALVQTHKFIFDSEILSGYRFSHSYSLDVMSHPHFLIPIEYHGEGTDENFVLPYTLRIYLEAVGREYPPAPFGTLTISLVEETSTSIEVKYKLEPISLFAWTWPLDWLGTLSCHVQFASQSPGTDPGDAPPDQPHYPPDEPDTPPDDEPDDGWEYEEELPFLLIAWQWNPGSSESTIRSRFNQLLDLGINSFVCQHHIDDYRDDPNAISWYDRIYNIADRMGIFVIWYLGIHRISYTNPTTGETFISRYRKHSSCAGFTYGDEPNYMGWEHSGCKWAVDEG
ncbi:unnamed protein product, partial [marine sediment metagenome]